MRTHGPTRQVDALASAQALRRARWPHPPGGLRGLRWLRWLAGIGLVALLASCAQEGGLRREGASGDEPAASALRAALQWPAAPEPARIAWERSFARPADLGVTRSFWQRLGDFLFGGQEARMVRPMAVVTQGSAVLVADPGARGVHRFDPARGVYQLVRQENGRELPAPVGLARCGADVLVTDSSLASVWRIGPDDSVARPLVIELRAAGPDGSADAAAGDAVRGDGAARLRQPTGIACDAATDRVFVSDTAAHRIVVFRRTGEGAALRYETVFGTRGAGPGEFNFPTHLWWSDAGRLVVSDALNFRVQVLDGAGRFEGQFGRAGDASGDAARPKGVATDAAGNIFVVDALFHAFQIFDAQGRLLLGVGARGGAPGEFWLPTGIFIDAGRIWVADSYNGRVQVFRSVGGEAP